jgi:hypothetical protein
MEITCVPDLGVAMPPDDMPHALLKERVEAACKTIHELAKNGLDAERLAPEYDDSVIVDDLVTSFAKDEEAASKSLSTSAFSQLRPAVILQINDSLQEFSHAVVRNAVQIRNFVTNKLLLEASNPDAKVRIRALELLGKISDVGLFTERSEVTVTHRSTEDLRKSLREKLDSLRLKAQPVQEITDVTEINADVVDAAPLIDNLDAEIGYDPSVSYSPFSDLHKTLVDGGDA